MYIYIYIHIHIYFFFKKNTPSTHKSLTVFSNKPQTSYAQTESLFYSLFFLAGHGLQVNLFFVTRRKRGGGGKEIGRVEREGKSENKKHSLNWGLLNIHLCCLAGNDPCV